MATAMLGGSGVKMWREEGPHLGDGRRDPLGVSTSSPVSVAPPCTSAALGAALSPWKYQLEAQKARVMFSAAPAFLPAMKGPSGSGTAWEKEACRLKPRLEKWWK